MNVDDRTYFTLLELAIGNPVRTPAQHAALVAECRQHDNVFVNWSANAAEGWLFKPCEACGEDVQHDAPALCWACYQADLVAELPGLATP